MHPSRNSFAVLVALLACALLVPTGAGAAKTHRGEAEGAQRRVHRSHRAGGRTPVGLGQGIPVSTRAKPSQAGSKPAVTTVPAPPTPPAESAPPPTAPVTPPAGPEGEGSVLFQNGFDGSFAGWYVQSLSYRATIDTAHPEMGSGAGRFEVQPGDREPDTGGQRSEVVGPTFKEGQNVYIRDDIRIPYGYSYQGPWQLIDQLHETNWGSSPGTATFLDPERRISFDTGTNSIQFWRGPQLEFEQWYDLVFRIDFSQNPSEGYVEVWWNGVQQTLTNGQTRMYAKTVQMPETYLKAGVFRSSESTGVSIVEHDNIVVGTSLASVMDN